MPVAPIDAPTSRPTTLQTSATTGSETSFLRTGSTGSRPGKTAYTAYTAAPSMLPADGGGVGGCTVPTGTDPDAPASFPVGTLDYYEQRAADFRRRNPCMDPPDYYLSYGGKYAERFASLDATDLSPEGRAWRDRTLVNLQAAIEAKIAEDPAAFAELERNPDKFLEFAYGTHPDAYIDAGLFDLSAQDIAVIAATPDLKDVLTKAGIGQILVTMGKLSPSDLADITVATVDQTLQDGMPALDIPQLIGHATVREAERIFDRFTDHTDWSSMPPQLPWPWPR